MIKFPRKIYASASHPTGSTKHLTDNSGNLKIPEYLEISGTLEIEAEGSAKGSKGQDLPSFELIANTGKPMDLNGFFDPVIMDLVGAKYDKSVTPVIGDHDTSRRIGHTIEQKVVAAGKTVNFNGKRLEGPIIVARGVVSSKMGIATGFVEDARAGFPFQVSVGATILEAYYLEEGEKATVNSRSVKGPLIVATKTAIRELTITVLGADNDTAATLAAKRFHHSKDSDMNFEAWVKSQGFEVADLTPDQLKAMKKTYAAIQAMESPSTTSAPKKGKIKATVEDDDDTEVDGIEPFDINASRKEHNALLAANSVRIGRIEAACRQHSSIEKVKVDNKEMTVLEFQAHAIQNDLTVDQTELVLLKASLGQSQEAPAFHMVTPFRDLKPEAISAAVCRQLGMQASVTNRVNGHKWGYEHFFDQKTLEASDNPDLRNISLHQLMDMTIHAAGMSFHGNRKSDAFRQKCQEALQKIKASGSGRSTMTLVNVFEDSSNKLLLAGYNGVDTVWQEITRVRNVSDFKVHNLYRMTSKGGYHQIGVDGQLDHGTWSEQKYTLSADTYGKIVGLDRRHIINDDLDVFSTIMTSLGVDAARSMEELVFVLLLGSLATLFPANDANGNYMSGAATALSIEALTTATTKFGNHVDDDTAPILQNADRILCGKPLEIAAGRLYKEARTTPTGGASAEDRFTDNPHVGAFRPIVTPYMNNTAIKQRVDATNLGAAIGTQSDTQWILMGNPNSPMGALLYVALLNGNRTPTLQSADSQFDMLGMQWRGYHDFGTGLGDPVFGLYSKGAA